MNHMNRMAAISLACSALSCTLAFGDEGFNPLRRIDDGIGSVASIAQGADDLEASLPFNAQIAADQLAVANDFGQLRSDVRAGNTAAISLDQAKIMTDFATLQADETTLRNNIAANPAVQAALAAVLADRMALDRDAVQLRSDEIVGNDTAIETDETQVQTDQSTLRSDLRALRAAIAAVTI